MAHSRLAGKTPHGEASVVVPSSGDTKTDDAAVAPKNRSLARLKGLGALFWVAVTWLTVVGVTAVLAPLLPLVDPAAQDYEAVAVPPGSPGHILGTDSLGRDLLARAIFGARISMIVTLSAVVIGIVVGGLLGMLAGYFRGWLEKVIMAATDALMAFPALVLLLALMATLGSSIRNLVIGLGILGIPAFVRLTRASTLVYAQREFVTAAKSIGALNRRVLLREIMPNIVPAVAAYAFIVVALLIVAEGSLSFLGVGVPPPASSWGLMIAEGRDSLRTTPWITFIPGAFMFLTVLSFNLAGDRLREENDNRGGNA
ncbi:ABC transporter permease [Sphaerimonospora mesophila]|uniref:ABC transporter permease n=1 Tax=Sphaerimonospora mesophila TaxID=37483 RepID=UPI0009F98DE3